MACAIKNIRDVKYFNGSLYYQIDDASEKKLVNNDYTKLKNFIVIDITEDIIYTKEEFIGKFFHDYYPEVGEVLNELRGLRYKVFKKIKITL